MKRLCKNKYWKINKEYNIDKILYLLIERPDFISFITLFYWKNKKEQIHRNYDLPAVIFNDGDLYWYENNKLNRENNKPARILIDGQKEYWLNHNLYKKEK